MTLSKKPYKGTRDFFPADKRLQNYIFEQMAYTAQSFGYEPYDGPLLEAVELYQAKSGQELINEQIYSFYDRGERWVAIRPEMTPTVARMVAQIHKETPKPIRWYSIPNLYRYERPQRGRLREHWQFNADIFGAPGKSGELEILQLIVSLLKNLGAQKHQFKLLLNDRQLVDQFFQKTLGLAPPQHHDLLKLIDQVKKLKPEDLQKKIQALHLPADSSQALEQYLAIGNFSQLESFLDRYQLSPHCQDFLTFMHQIGTLELADYIDFDPSIVRGLDYYTGIVFEVFDLNPENRRAICGGGAYANLLQIFDEPPLTGVGFGLGDVTLSDFLRTHKLLPDLSTPHNHLLLSFQQDEGRLPALQLAQGLRSQGLKVINALEPLKPNKVFKQAEHKGCDAVAFLGKDEMEQQTLTVKNLARKEQRTFSQTDLAGIKDFIQG